MARAAATRILLAAAAAASTGLAFAGTGEVEQPFEARHLVEMATVGEPVTAPGMAGPIIHSPDRRHFAFVVQRGDIKADLSRARLRVYSVSAARQAIGRGGCHSLTPVAEIERASSSNAPPIHGLRWSADGASLFFLSQAVLTAPEVTSDAPQQVFRLTLAPGALEQLTDAPFGVETFDASGPLLAYQTIVEQQPRAAGLVRYPASALDSEYFASLTGAMYRSRARIFYRLGNSQPVAISPAYDLTDRRAPTFASVPGGRGIVMVSNTEDLPSAPRDAARMDTSSTRQRRFALVYHDVRSGEERRLGTSEFRITRRHMLFTSDGHLLAAVPEVERDRLTWTVRDMNLATGETTVIAHGDPVGVPAGGAINPLLLGDVSLAWAKPDRRLVIGFRPRPFPADAAGSTTRSFVYTRAESGWVASPVSHEPARRGEEVQGGLSVHVRQSPVDPPRVHAAIAGRSCPLSEADPVLSGVSILPVRTYQFDVAGESWQAGLILPRRLRATPPPLVIQLGRFDPDVFDPAGGGPVATFAAQPLAAAGFAVLTLPASRVIGRGPEEGPGIVQAIDAAIDALVADRHIDVRRVGLLGHSRTGYLVTYAVSHPGRHMLSAALSNEGMKGSYLDYLLYATADDLAGGISPSTRNIEALFNGSGRFWQNRAAWIEAAPGFNLDQVRTPLLLTGSGAERGLPFWDFEIYAGLRLLDRPVELISFPHGAHVLGHPRQRLASFELTVDWFRFWLKDEERTEVVPWGNETAASLQEQYVRWRKMRQQQDAILARPGPPLLKWSVTPIEHTTGPEAPPQEHKKKGLP